ncbi:MAG: sulfatase [Planctomycetaceae bacterium]
MKLLPFPCVFLAGVVAAFSDAASAAKPNVVFIVADDLNCDLGCYGHPQVHSPHIDALARRGVLFEHAYCQYPVCNPSRASFMTGRRPNETRILALPKGARFSSDYEYGHHFRDTISDTLTLPELFRQHGFQAARVGKVYHFGVPGQIGTSGLDDRQSWDYLVNPAGRDKAEENKVFTLTPGSFGGSLSWLAMDGSDDEQTDGLCATAAISLLEEYHANQQPFFLAVGFYRPHTPYVAPKRYFDLYPPDQITLPELSIDDRRREPPAAFAGAKAVEDALTDDVRRRAIQGYRAATSFLDAQVGRVVDALDRLGLAENTIVVLTSDHGYHMSEHGLWQKMTLFENSARVPLIIAGPGAAADQTAGTMSELVDLYPTIADLCGLTPPEYVDGVSLRPALENSEAEVKAAAFTQLVRNGKLAYSIRTARWRYTLWDDGREGEQLFDMESDPRETSNLAGDPQYAAAIRELRQQLRAYAQ